MIMGKSLLRSLKYSLKHLLWILNGIFGKAVSLGSPQQFTVLITYFNPLRMNNIDHQVRNLLKCNFVQKIVLSNHNPDVKIGDMLHATDRRVMTMDQDIKRACGYRWQVARNLNAEYLVVIDDDILLFPKQLKTLCEHLILKPDVPHGSSGMLRQKGGEFQYREREEMEVEYLCEVYAVTQMHVERYFEMERTLERENQGLLDDVERLGDY